MFYVKQICSNFEAKRSAKFITAFELHILYLWVHVHEIQYDFKLFQTHVQRTAHVAAEDTATALQINEV